MVVIRAAVVAAGGSRPWELREPVAGTPRNPRQPVAILRRE